MPCLSDLKVTDSTLSELKVTDTLVFHKQSEVFQAQVDKVQLQYPDASREELESVLWAAFSVVVGDVILPDIANLASAALTKRFKGNA